MIKRDEPVLIMAKGSSPDDVVFHPLPPGDWLLPVQSKCGVSFQNRTKRTVTYKLLSAAKGTLPLYRNIPPGRYAVDKPPAPKHLYDGWMRIIVLDEGLEYVVFVVQRDQQTA
jgi:hypothetical protein